MIPLTLTLTLTLTLFLFQQPQSRCLILQLTLTLSSAYQAQAPSTCHLSEFSEQGFYHRLQSCKWQLVGSFGNWFGRLAT
jgi:hypothetical protein